MSIFIHSDLQTELLSTIRDRINVFNTDFTNGGFVKLRIYGEFNLLTEHDIININSVSQLLSLDSSNFTTDVFDWESGNDNQPSYVKTAEIVRKQDHISDEELVFTINIMYGIEVVKGSRVSISSLEFIIR